MTHIFEITRKMVTKPTRYFTAIELIHSTIMVWLISYDYRPSDMTFTGSGDFHCYSIPALLCEGT